MRQGEIYYGCGHYWCKVRIIWDEGIEHFECWVYAPEWLDYGYQDQEAFKISDQSHPYVRYVHGIL